MLTSAEFNTIMSVYKKFKDNSSIIIPSNGGKINRTLLDANSNDEFLLNIERGRINIKKVKYQTRHKRTNSNLLRIDLTGPRHQNPDGEYIECPHIHIYKENYGDKWAFPLDKNVFNDTDNLSNLLKDFLIYFNVDDIPCILYMETLI